MSKRIQDLVQNEYTFYKDEDGDIVFYKDGPNAGTPVMVPTSRSRVYIGPYVSEVCIQRQICHWVLWIMWCANRLQCRGKAITCVQDKHGRVVKEQTMLHNPLLSIHPRKIDEDFLLEDPWLGDQNALAMSGLPENKAALDHQCKILPRALQKICRGDLGPLGASATMSTMGWACPLLQSIIMIDSVSRGAAPHQTLYGLTTYTSALLGTMQHQCVCR